MKCGILLLILMLFTTTSFADSFTVTSYYPVPSGSYDRLQLKTRGSLSGSCDVGTMYVNTSGQFQYCQDDGAGSGIWGGVPTVWTQTGDNLYPTDTASNPNLFVGIGTTNPTAQLHVAGAGEIKLENESVGLKFMETSATDFFHIHSSNSILAFEHEGDGIDTKEIFYIKSNGYVGIGEADPLHLFHISNGNILATGTHGTDTSLTVSGAGTRLMWYPRKSAFRAGYAAETDWDDGHIGEASVAMGYRTKAALQGAAFGYYANAAGGRATAMGKITTASGAKSTAFGYESTASGGMSTAMGYSSLATYDYSTAIGNDAEATGNTAVALSCYAAHATGDYSSAFGKVTVAQGDYSTAFGYGSNAIGDYSLAMGYHAKATGIASTALGKENIAAGAYSTTFGRGIKTEGTNSMAIALSNQSGTVVTQNNTLIIMGGLVGFGTKTPTEVLHVDGNIYATGSITDGSSRAFKKNIQPLSLKDAFETLEHLRPVTFHYKAEKIKDLHIGFIAEDVPDLVATPDRRSICAMDITAIISKVIQDQEKRLTMQEKTIKQNQKEIQKMKQYLTNL